MGKNVHIIKNNVKEQLKTNSLILKKGVITNDANRGGTST